MNPSTRVVPVANLREFFKDELHGALEKQQVAVEDQTEHYVVNLLTLFSRSEALYESTSEGTRLKPLAVMLSDALEAPSAGDRNRGLQRLGDVSLFIAGFFARSFARKLIVGLSVRICVQTTASRCQRNFKQDATDDILASTSMTTQAIVRINRSFTLIF